MVPVGGSVTLTCNVNHSADLEYEWFRQTSKNSEKTTVAGESDRVLVTSEAGFYTCRARVKESDSVIIHETVVLKPRRGERQTQGPANQESRWSKWWPSPRPCNRSRWRCHAGGRKKHLGRTVRQVEVFEDLGAPIQIWPPLLPPLPPLPLPPPLPPLLPPPPHYIPIRPTVILLHTWPQIYSGETVTVRCLIQGGEGAQYEWSPAKLNTPLTSNEYTSITVTESDSGGYSCRGIWDNSFTEWSEVITLTLLNKPKAKLRADNTAVPVGGSVTLTCSVNPSSSSGWKYYWYRDGKSSDLVTSGDAVFLSNNQVSVSEGGGYWCRGGRGNPVYYTEWSQSVRIDTTVSNRPVVTLYPNWSEIYRGETITVRCEIHGGDTEWDYEWETNSTIKPPNQTEYRIRSASSSNSGNYRCKGRMKSSQHQTTEWSDSVTLTVSTSKPRATLTRWK
ncbi:B-cell receptor CD22 [Oreochromis niloticus]|uniref:B-cell receptor CD22 n=1 Tax=Oreochromis niloticus TaxID=8128 RepID=UPI000DF1884F|nr:B-cell receptor CD22-like [Oreochromis niloticus]